METALKKVWLASPDSIWLTGMIVILTRRNDLEICGESRTGPATRQMAGLEQADLLVIDSTLPGSALEVTRDIRRISPATKVLIVGPPKDLLMFRNALAAGAGGLAEWNASSKEIELAARMVLAGYPETIRDIAEQFGISVKTVESHVERIKRKLHLGGIEELRGKARKWWRKQQSLTGQVYS